MEFFVSNYKYREKCNCKLENNITLANYNTTMHAL